MPPPTSHCYAGTVTHSPHRQPHRCAGTETVFLTSPRRAAPPPAPPCGHPCPVLWPPPGCSVGRAFTPAAPPCDHHPLSLITIPPPGPTSRRYAGTETVFLSSPTWGGALTPPHEPAGCRPPPVILPPPEHSVGRAFTPAAPLSLPAIPPPGHA